LAPKSNIVYEILQKMRSHDTKVGCDKWQKKKFV